MEQIKKGYSQNMKMFSDVVKGIFKQVVVLVAAHLSDGTNIECFMDSWKQGGINGPLMDAKTVS